MRHIRPSTMTVPKKAHPLVKLMFREMIKQRITVVDMAARSGVRRETIAAWRSRNSPSLANAEAVLGALGWRLRATVQEAAADE